MIDQPTIRAVEASIYAAGYPTDAAAALLIEVDGALAGLERDVDVRRGHLSRESGALGAHRARRSRAHEALAGTQEGLRRDGPARSASRDSGRGGAAHAAARSARARSIASAKTNRVRICNVFHAGDGNLHPNIPYDASDADETARVHLAMTEIMARVRRGGRNDHR